MVDYFIEALGDNDSRVAAKGSENKTLKIAMLGPDGQPLAPATARERSRPRTRRRGREPEPVLRAGLRQRRRLDDGQGRGQRDGQGRIRPGSRCRRLLHFAPEVGYYLSPELLLSVQLRFQLDHRRHDVPLEYERPDRSCGDDDVCSPGNYAFAGFARASYFFGEGDLRTYVAGTAGARHDPPRRRRSSRSPICGSDQMTTCVDTVPSGPVFVGGGRRHHVQPEPGVRADASERTLLLGFTKFTFHVDLNAGVAFEF